MFFLSFPFYSGRDALDVFEPVIYHLPCLLSAFYPQKYFNYLYCVYLFIYMYTFKGISPPPWVVYSLNMYYTPFRTSLYFIYYNACCRFLKRILLRSRIMGYGYGIRVEQGTIICTKNIGTPHWTVLLNKCTMRWLPDTEWGSLAFKSSKPPPFQPSFARGRALNSFTTPRLSSLLSTRRLGPQIGSSRPPIRHQGLTSLCNCIMHWVFLFLPIDQIL